MWGTSMPIIVYTDAVNNKWCQLFKKVSVEKTSLRYETLIFQIAISNQFLKDVP